MSKGTGVRDGFQVTMTDLRQAAGVFRAEAGTFAAIMPGGGPASVDGGSAEITAAQGFRRPAEFELPVLLAVLLLGSGLVFVRALERWL